MSNRGSFLFRGFVVACVWYTLQPIDGHIAGGQLQIARDVRSPVQRYCGPRMSEMLVMVCRGKRNPLFSKRTSQKMEDEYQALNDDMEIRTEMDYPGAPFGQLSQSEFPLLTKTRALSIISDENFRRKRQGGIVEECCVNPCSLEDLGSYCGNF